MTIRGTEQVSRCARCRYYCRTGATFVFSHIGLCSLVFGYTVMGAFTFEALEAPNELRNRQKMIEAKNNVTRDLWTLTSSGAYLSEGNWSENATAMLKNFEMNLVKAVRKEGFDGSESGTPQWSFSGALLYSIIVITTIGYGNIAPKTATGKIVTILYAIIGIPLLLLCLSNIGDAMAHSFKFIYWKVCCYLCSSPKTPHKRSNSQRYSRRGEHHSRRSIRDSNTVGRKLYRGTSEASAQYEQQRSYALTSSPHATQAMYSTPQSTTEYWDIHRVPIITNKYAMYSAETPVADISQQSLRGMGVMEPSLYRASGSSAQRPPALPQRAQDSSAFTGFGDDLDYREESSDEEEEEGEEENEDERSVPIMLCISIVVGYICGGAMLFSYWEDWDYSDSCYFCFITLTTIGFGDMVPGTAVLSEESQLALGLCSLYLLFGMALLAMSFNLVQEEVTKSVKSIGRRIGILSEEDEDDDDDDI